MYKVFSHESGLKHVETPYPIILLDFGVFSPHLIHNLH